MCSSQDGTTDRSPCLDPLAILWQIAEDPSALTCADATTTPKCLSLAKIHVLWSTMKHYPAKNDKNVYISDACKHAKTEWTNHDKPNISPHQPTIPTNTNNLVTIDTIVQVSYSSCSSERPLFKITSLSGETAMMLRTSWQGHPFQVHRQHVQLIVYGSTWVNFPAKQHKCAKSKHVKTFCMASGHPSHHGNPFEECSMQISMNWLMMIDDHTPTWAIDHHSCKLWL